MRLRHTCFALVLLFVWSAPAVARQTRAYAGTIAGFSILSGDGRSVTDSERSSVSLYDPSNGPALNVFGGWALGDWVSLQGNYIWNRNRLTLTASDATADDSRFYEQTRTSSHHSVFGDALVYFRGRGERIRPYLSTGVGLVRFESRVDETRVRTGEIPVPGPVFSDTTLVIRSAVGMDIRIADGWTIRYSFSEFIGPNPISRELEPEGNRVLMNFQNLWGIVRTF